MKQAIILAISSILALLLAACGQGQVFEDPSQKATREAQGGNIEQTVAAVGTQSSTLVALQSTAEHAVIMATQIGQLTVQNQALQSTLTSMSLVNRSTTIPQQGVTQQQQQVVTQPQGLSQEAPPASTGGQSGFPTPAAGATATIPSSSAGATFSSTTATGIDNATGCALDSVASFDSTEDQIYMVANSNNVIAGNTYSVRWLYEGELSFESSSWAADADYPQICIWFYAEGPFSAGTWTAEFTENGTAVSTSTFTISGDAMTEGG